MVKDERTCTQLQEYLEVGGKVMLERRFQKYLESKQEQQQYQQQQKSGIEVVTTIFTLC
jgi:hypothetical protein